MKHILHGIISVVLWAVFFYHWEIVASRTVSHGTILAVRALTVIITVGTIATFWWIIHNLRISRRNRRRASLAAAPESLDVDNLGRTVIAPPLPLLKSARVVDIHISEGEKIYEIAEGAG